MPAQRMNWANAADPIIAHRCYRLYVKKKKKSQLLYNTSRIPSGRVGFKHFRDIILGCEITVYTDYAAVTELFKGKNLTEKLARWHLTIKEFSSKFKYIQRRSNVVAGALSRNALVGAVSDTPLVTNFSLQALGTAQRKHDVWTKVTCALESGDGTTLPRLSIPFSQFSYLKTMFHADPGLRKQKL